MKTHTTNYVNTFIEVAEDTRASSGTKPSTRASKKTIAEMQFDLLYNQPYQSTSDEILFQVYAERNDLIKEEFEEAKTQFFSKGQPCFRASPLSKNYGFGIHYDNDAKMAIYGMETEEYAAYMSDDRIKKIKAMKSSKS